ncbi:zinc finger CCCH-type with G patch domain-containing protein-like [Argonauta hians]
MDEDTLQQNIDLYTAQLQQVESALQASGPNEDLLKLKTDLQEVVKLTEASLLSLKKSQLLMHLESSDVNKSPSSTPIPPNVPTTQTPDLDAEYEAFKNSLSSDIDFTKNDSSGTSAGCSTNQGPSWESGQKEASNNRRTKKYGGSGNSSDDDDDDDSDNVDDDNDDEHEEENKRLMAKLQELVGTKCRVMYNTDWAKYGYHNALITDVLPFNAYSPAKVQVMFCNPIHRNMVPCQYFLNGKCKFSDEKCNFSHGYDTSLDDIRPYHEPDYSSLQLNGKCMACYTDGLWCHATIEGFEADGQFVVAFEGRNDVLVVGADKIMPVAVIDEESSHETDKRQEIDDDDDDDDSEEDISDGADGDGSPMLKYITPKTTMALGQWEAHTKGIGSRLMSKMGYIAGQGLGRNGQGKTEPVPIEVLPVGKSLDAVMNLKEQAANKNLFNVLDNKKAKKTLERKNKAAYRKSGSTNVFDFINNKLDKKTEQHPQNSGVKIKKRKNIPNESCKEISLQELSKKSDRTLNIQMMKTEEELRRVDREILKLHQSISRNEDRNQSIVKSIQEKLNSLEAYKSQLQVSEKAIGQQKNQRNAHKKLTIF